MLLSWQKLVSVHAGSGLIGLVAEMRDQSQLGLHSVHLKEIHLVFFSFTGCLHNKITASKKVSFKSKKANYRPTIVLAVICNKLILSEQDLWQRVSLLAMTRPC